MQSLLFVVCKCIMLSLRSGMFVDMRISWWKNSWTEIAMCCGVPLMFASIKCCFHWNRIIWHCLFIYSFIRSFTYVFLLPEVTKQASRYDSKDSKTSAKHQLEQIETQNERAQRYEHWNNSAVASKVKEWMHEQYRQEEVSKTVEHKSRNYAEHYPKIYKCWWDSRAELVMSIVFLTV